MLQVINILPQKQRSKKMDIVNFYIWCKILISLHLLATFLLSVNHISGHIADSTLAKPIFIFFSHHISKQNITITQHLLLTEKTGLFFNQIKNVVPLKKGKILLKSINFFKKEKSLLNINFQEFWKDFNRKELWNHISLPKFAHMNQSCKIYYIYPFESQVLRNYLKN